MIWDVHEIYSVLNTCFHNLTVVYIYRKKGEPIKLVFTGKKKGITPVASFSALDKEGEDPTPSAAAEPKPSNDPAEDDISTL